jgi:hypothetical protein
MESHILVQYTICARQQFFRFRISFVIVDASYLHRIFSLFYVDGLFSFFPGVVSTCALNCLVLLMDGFSSLIFIYKIFLPNKKKGKRSDATLQNFIYKHSIDLENVQKKKRKEKEYFQDIKLGQIKCQNLFKSESDYLQ